MTLAVPIFDAFGRVQMILQCPGLIDKVSRNEAKMAEAILRTGERLNAIIGGSSETPSDIRIALS
jgi:DNA-binding IclR family transcriptional regulator